MESNFLIEEMDLCRKYCSAIQKERQKAGFNSLRYPLISVKINRYFLREFREIIAEECNLIGYLGIKPVEYCEQEKSYDETGEIKVSLDPTKSDWQQEMFNERTAKAEQNQSKKLSTPTL